MLVQAIPCLVGSLPPVVEVTAYVARRPLPLVEVRPSARAQRHIVEDLGELAPSVQILDLPVPRTVDSVTDVLRLLDRPLAEQAISVPKISCSPCPSRSRVSEPQSAEQLVEVPTVLTPTRIAVQIAEQIVDTSARGSLPGQRSAARRPAQSSRRRFIGRIWHMPAAGLYGNIESDSAKAAYAFEGDVPFFLEGSCRLGDHVTFAVGRVADGLEAFDLKVVGRGEGLGIPSPHPGCHFLPRMVVLVAVLGSDMFLAGCWYIAVLAVFPFGCRLARLLSLDRKDIYAVCWFYVALGDDFVAMVVFGAMLGSTLDTCSSVRCDVVWW